MCRKFWSKCFRRGWTWEKLMFSADKPQIIQTSLVNWRNIWIWIALKGGYRIFFYSCTSPVGHNIWWENSQNGSFGPKNGKRQKKLIFLGLSCLSIFIVKWTSLHWHRYRNVTIQLLETGRSFVTGWYFPSVAADFSLIRFHELPLAWVQSYALLAGLPWWWGRRCCCCRRGWMVTDRQSWNEPLQVMYFWRILY